MKADNYIVTNQDIYDCVNGTNGGDPLGRTWEAKITIPQDGRGLTHSAVQALVELDTTSFQSGWTNTQLVMWTELTPTDPNPPPTQTDEYEVFGSVYDAAQGQLNFTMNVKMSNGFYQLANPPCGTSGEDVSYTIFDTVGGTHSGTVTIPYTDTDVTTPKLSGVTIDHAIIGSVSPSSCGAYTITYQSGEIS